MLAYRIPKHDEDPSQEMIDWINRTSQPWDGDENGIILYGEGGAPDATAGPGDYIVEDNGVYSVVLAADFDKEKYGEPRT